MGYMLVAVGAQKAMCFALRIRKNIKVSLPEVMAYTSRKCARIRDRDRYRQRLDKSPIRWIGFVLIKQKLCKLASSLKINANSI